MLIDRKRRTGRQRRDTQRPQRLPAAKSQRTASPIVWPNVSENPNCILNAVEGATGLARPFGNVFVNNTIGHDGVHAVAPVGSRVRTLPALTGEVIDIHIGGTPGILEDTLIVDVLLDNGNIAIYKDLTKVYVKRNQRLEANSLIGEVGGGENMGLHFTLLKGGMREHDAYRDISSGRKKKPITVGMFLNPLDPADSSTSCPGTPVENADVTPYPLKRK